MLSLFINNNKTYFDDFIIIIKCKIIIDNNVINKLLIDFIFVLFFLLGPFIDNNKIYFNIIIIIQYKKIMDINVNKFNSNIIRINSYINIPKIRIKLSYK